MRKKNRGETDAWNHHRKKLTQGGGGELNSNRTPTNK